MFYFITAENYFGTPNVALLPDKEGRLVKGSEQIKSTSSSKAMIMHKPGNNKIYQLITIGDDKRARCYEIDSRENGFGNSTNKGGEVVSETILPNAENIGNHIAVIEDEVNQKNYVYMQQYVEPDVQTELPHVKLLAYEFPVSGEIEQHTLAEFDGYSINGDGEIQISPDGNNILLYNLKKKLGGFDHRKVDIIMMKFAGDKLSIIPENTIHASKLGGNYGKASSDFTQSEEHGSNIVFNQHSIILTPPGDIESDKQTRHINTNSNILTQIENIKEKGDIRRGLNNNLYLAGYKKSSLQQNINKIYELTTTGVIGASQVNLEDNDYYLSASLPGQIYRIETSVNQTVFSRQVGLKQYELTNHLGNVMATVSDIKYSNGTGFDANISSIQNYYPFGSIMEGRLFTGNDYRFGFGGKENVDEVYGVTGSFQDYGMREYDTRIARFIKVDPLTKKFPMLTPYQFASNTPIWAIDLDGLEAWTVTNKWNFSDLGKYHDYAKTQIPIYNSDKVEDDCSDFALRVIIDYAEQNGLEIELVTASGAIINSSDKNYSSKEEFLEDAQSKINASAIAKNTFVILDSQAKEGDIRIQVDDEKIPRHTVVISDVENNRITYGNPEHPHQNEAGELIIDPAEVKEGNDYLRGSSETSAGAGKANRWSMFEHLVPGAPPPFDSSLEGVKQN